MGGPDLLGLSKPIITKPDPTVVLQTKEKAITLQGKVDSASVSLYINDKKASYTAGSPAFELTLDLEEGENIIRVQSVDGQGNKSKTAVVRVMMVP